jgi:hypothetical protein
MADEGVTSGAAAGKDKTAEAVTTELMGEVASRLQEYVKAWFASYDRALRGDYDAASLVADAGRMTSALIRDTAKLVMSGFDTARLLGNPSVGRPAAAPGTAKGSESNRAEESVPTRSADR